MIRPKEEAPIRTGEEFLKKARQQMALWEGDRSLRRTCLAMLIDGALREHRTRCNAEHDVFAES